MRFLTKTDMGNSFSSTNTCNGQGKKEKRKCKVIPISSSSEQFKKEDSSDEKSHGSNHSSQASGSYFSDGFNAILSRATSASSVIAPPQSPSNSSGGKKGGVNSLQKLRSVDPRHGERDAKMDSRQVEAHYWADLDASIHRGSWKTVQISSVVGQQFSGAMRRMPRKEKKRK
jgi:hypothetical protein